jgi:hypothetical protein
MSAELMILAAMAVFALAFIWRLLAGDAPEDNR